MTPERWKQVGKLYQAALKLQPEARASFLDEACRNDKALRRELESLIAAEGKAGSFLAGGAMNDAAKMLIKDKEKSFPLIGQELGHCRLLSVLGAGGMGEVYLAEDTRLKRRVAVKVLPAELTARRDSARRFEREARAASALNHPNIITIHEIGESGGVHYLVTEFIEGETLRERLKRGPLEVSAVLEVIVQVVSALAAAHDAGIVHRDIKPENIMLRRDGLVKVLDFGLAKLTETPVPSSSAEARTLTKLTQAGLIMGTCAYMSPEQARGLKVDARTDIFSLGIVLHEMITGRVPFEGSTASDVIAAILKSEPPPLADSTREVPRELEHIVNRTLRKNPEERYQVIKDLLLDLSDLKRTLTASAPVVRVARPGFGLITANRKTVTRLAVGLLLIVIVAAAVAYNFWLRYRGPTNAAGVSSMAVLPFKPLLPGGRDEALEMGMADTLITKLGGVGEVAVRPISAVRIYTGLDQDAVQAGKELGVEAVLDGSIHRVGERIRVTARLVRVADGSQLWSSQFDEKFTDIFALQDTICERVARELALNLRGEKRERLTKHYTVNADAYQLYLKGRYFWYKPTLQDSLKAREFFQQAIDLDPSFALAYCGLADYYGRASATGQMRPDEGWPKHEAAVMKALELDPDFAEVHNSLAGLKVYYYRDLPGAENEFKRALELDPNYVEARAHYGGYLTTMGRFDEGIAQVKRAQELDPLSADINRRFGVHLYRARRYDEAIEQYLNTLELDSSDARTHELLGDAYEQKRMFDKAVAAWREAMTLSRNDELVATLDHAYKESGYEGSVRAVSHKRLQQLGAKAQSGEYVPAMDFARLYVKLGDQKQALVWLEKAYEERSRLIFDINVDPVFDGLRSDPRFADLLRRLNLK